MMPWQLCKSTISAASLRPASLTDWPLPGIAKQMVQLARNAVRDSTRAGPLESSICSEEQQSGNGAVLPLGHLILFLCQRRLALAPTGHCGRLDACTELANALLAAPALQGCYWHTSSIRELQGIRSFIQRVHPASGRRSWDAVGRQQLDMPGTVDSFPTMATSRRQHV